VYKLVEGTRRRRRKNPGNFFLCGGLSHDEVTLIAQETRKRKKECRPAVGFLSVRWWWWALLVTKWLIGLSLSL
jgi:hypothetical protein